MAIDIEKVEDLLSQISNTSNQLLYLVRQIKQGKVFEEDLPATLKTKLLTRAKNYYTDLKALEDQLEVETAK